MQDGAGPLTALVQMYTAIRQRAEAKRVEAEARDAARLAHRQMENNERIQLLVVC